MAEIFSGAIASGEPVDMSLALDVQVGDPAIDGHVTAEGRLDYDVDRHVARIDDLRVEIGYGLLPLINDARGYRLTDQIKALRRQIASDMGFVMPSVRILDNMQLPSASYAIRVKAAGVEP